MACINKFKRKGIANRIVANSCYGLKVVKIIVQLEQSHKNADLEFVATVATGGRVKVLSAV